ncbi:hypothetical protein PAXINDRAFT_22039 [Paxillus involutus ATCC 200175]|uniref:Uncharacterized protein n=1 Tax=Paxillus involutus ATCC 200175 TaxID=664439 RepID=A0A0C9T8Y2_PAXIN|nr:hypothetical protein PAXINDRAFT_22039 [Paxillus involutus ATCC 200175]
MTKKSNAARLVDGKIFQFAPERSTSSVHCLVCPAANGLCRTIDLKHVNSHANSLLHQRHVKYKTSGRTTLSGFHAPHPNHTDQEVITALPPAFPSTLHASRDPCNMDIDNCIGGFDAEEDPTPGLSNSPPLTHTLGLDETPLVPLNELWNVISNSRHQNIDGTGDLFQELQDALASGEPLFSMPVTTLNPFPCDDIVLDEDKDSDFGIELLDNEGDEPTHSSSVKNKVSPDSPTYPWPTKAHFLTALLFNSPRLPFSDPQKKAILDWAKELGARDVPSLYALKQRHEQVKKIVGDPTEKIVSPFGNVFYINDVAKAIAKDYANPLTRFAMQDFPEDGGSGMSQIFHGEKMLHELPSPPAVRVDGNIYYVDELLQDSSGGYFIPERFFLALPSVASGSSEGRPDTKELFALGRAAERTEAGFIVSDEKEIIPTSVFRRSYEDITFRRSELACGLTESSKKYTSLEPNPWRKKSGVEQALCDIHVEM